jgi:hypothetical protein
MGAGVGGEALHQVAALAAGGGDARLAGEGHGVAPGGPGAGFTEEGQPRQRQRSGVGASGVEHGPEAFQVRGAVRGDHVGPRAQQETLRDLLVNHADVTGHHERAVRQSGGGEQVQHRLDATAGQRDQQHVRHIGGDRFEQSGGGDGAYPGGVDAGVGQLPRAGRGVG